MFNFVILKKYVKSELLSFLVLWFVLNTIHYMAGCFISVFKFYFLFSKELVFYNNPFFKEDLINNYALLAKGRVHFFEWLSFEGGGLTLTFFNEEKSREEIVDKLDNLVPIDPTVVADLYTQLASQGYSLTWSYSAFASMILWLVMCSIYYHFFINSMLNLEEINNFILFMQNDEEFIKKKIADHIGEIEQSQDADFFNFVTYTLENEGIIIEESNLSVMFENLSWVEFIIENYDISEKNVNLIVELKKIMLEKKKAMEIDKENLIEQTTKYFENQLDIFFNYLTNTCVKHNVDLSIVQDYPKWKEIIKKKKKGEELADLESSYSENIHDAVLNFSKNYEENLRNYYENLWREIKKDELVWWMDWYTIIDSINEIWKDKIISMLEKEREFVFIETLYSFLDLIVFDKLVTFASFGETFFILPILWISLSPVNFDKFVNWHYVFFTWLFKKNQSSLPSFPPV